MENNKKYVLANIKIPMEINENGSFEPMPDYVSISIEKMDNAPQKSGIDYNNEYIREQILSLLTIKKCDNINNEEIEESSLIIKYDELLNRIQKSHNKNISFKNKKTSTSRYTAKNYL